VHNPSLHTLHIMASVAEKVKESLVGTEVEVGLSSQTRVDFMDHAVKDEETEEYYLDEKAFIDAIAPQGEDYVSITLSPNLITHQRGAMRLPLTAKMQAHMRIAQDQARAVRDPVQRRRPQSQNPHQPPRLGCLQQPARQTRRRV